MTKLDDMASVQRGMWVDSIHNAEIERLKAALRRIDALNDNPARYNSEINDVIQHALGERATVTQEERGT